MRFRPGTRANAACGRHRRGTGRVNLSAPAVVAAREAQDGGDESAGCVTYACAVALCPPAARSREPRAHCTPEMRAKPACVRRRRGTCRRKLAARGRARSRRGGENAGRPTHARSSRWPPPGGPVARTACAACPATCAKNRRASGAAAARGGFLRAAVRGRAGRRKRGPGHARASVALAAAGGPATPTACASRGRPRAPNRRPAAPRNGAPRSPRSTMKEHRLGSKGVMHGRDTARRRPIATGTSGRPDDWRVRRRIRNPHLIAHDRRGTTCGRRDYQESVLREGH